MSRLARASTRFKMSTQFNEVNAQLQGVLAFAMTVRYWQGHFISNGTVSPQWLNTNINALQLGIFSFACCLRQRMCDAAVFHLQSGCEVA